MSLLSAQGPSLLKANAPTSITQRPLLLDPGAGPTPSRRSIDISSHCRGHSDMPPQPSTDPAPPPGVAAQHRRRLVFLDSLRGIAAVLVVFSQPLHIPQPNPLLPNSFVARAIAFGGTGVSVIFVISGFLPLTLIVNQVTAFYGMIIYSVYICHRMIIDFGFDYFFVPDWSFVDILVSFLLTASLAPAVVAAAAFLTSTSIERPFIKAGRVLFHTLQWRQPGGTVAPGRAA